MDNVPKVVNTEIVPTDTNGVQIIDQRWGLNDKQVEVWSPKYGRWFPGWWSQVQKGWVFRFIGNQVLPEDKAFVAKEPTRYSYVNVRHADGNPTFSMGVVEVMQAPARVDAVVDLLPYEKPVQPQLEAPKRFNKDDVTDV